MEALTKLVHRQATGVAYNGAAPGGTRTNPAGAQGGNTVTHDYAAHANAGKFDPAVGGLARPRKLRRFTLKLASSVAWTLKLCGSDDVVLAVVLSYTSDSYAGDFDLTIMPGEYLKLEGGAGVGAENVATCTFGERQ